MSDYCREKVVRMRLTNDLLQQIGLSDKWDLEEKFPDLFARSSKVNIFETAPTEDDFLDYVLEYEYGACCGEYGFSKQLTETEIKEYLPKFQKIFPSAKEQDLQIIDFCWYNCSEAPDYFEDYSNQDNSKEEKSEEKELVQLLRYLPENIEIKGDAMLIAKWSKAMAVGADALEKLQKIEGILNNAYTHDYMANSELEGIIKSVENIVRSDINCE